MPVPGGIVHQTLVSIRLIPGSIPSSNGLDLAGLLSYACGGFTNADFLDFNGKNVTTSHLIQEVLR
jgi:hypothetical protein